MVAAVVEAPDRGQVVWLDFHPQAGHEQSGRRPALILSDRTYNHQSGLAVCCPLTNRVKGYPFEVPVPAELPVSGVILADHVRSSDWRARRAEFICDLPPQTVGDVAERVRVLVGG